MIYNLSAYFSWSLLQLLLTFLGVFLILKFFVPVIGGAPYLPTAKEKVEKMLDLLDLKPGQILIDLGSGDGRILIAAASRGLKAYGYEINPILVLLTRQKIKKLGLKNQANIFWKNFWKINLASADAITVFGASAIMDKLEKKFFQELKSGAKVCSYAFHLPHWNLEKKEEGIFIYLKK
jgi:cyclopropane fatty-acyl-phospholipid synthase-like methyltransferase